MGSCTTFHWEVVAVVVIHQTEISFNLRCESVTYINYVTQTVIGLWLAD